VCTLTFAASLKADAWDARLSPAVPAAFQARAMRAWAHLYARLPQATTLITTDDLWSLAEPPPDSTPAPDGFAIASLAVSSTPDRALHFALMHVLSARGGRVIFDLLHAKRDVQPVHPSRARGSPCLCLAVYDRPSARQQLEHLCAPLLVELRQLISAASDAHATVELQWIAAAARPRPLEPSARRCDTALATPPRSWVAAPLPVATDKDPVNAPPVRRAASLRTAAEMSVAEMSVVETGLRLQRLRESVPCLGTKVEGAVLVPMPRRVLSSPCACA